MKIRSTVARAAVSVGLAIFLTACAAAMPIINALEQVACVIVPAFVKSPWDRRAW